MLESDSPDSFGIDAVLPAPRRGGDSRHSGPALSQHVTEIQPLPCWARLDATACDAPAAAFLAGANLLALDLILRSGDAGAEPFFSGVLRQRLALKAAATCARLARLREDATALRDAEHLSGAGVETSPAGRVHRLWRLFGSRAVKFDAAILSLAIEYLEAQDVVDVRELADAVRGVVASADNPLAAAARASAAAAPYLTNLPAIHAEIFALWLADVALAQRLGWRAPLPLLATAIAHLALRCGQHGRRPRSRDPDWAEALTSAYALSAREAFDLAVDLARRAKKLQETAPKLRAKGASRVIEMLLADDCVAPARAANMAKLSDRGARRLFDRLTELGVVREVSGRSSFRLYGL